MTYHIMKTINHQPHSFFMTYLGPKCFAMVPPSPVATTLQSLQDFHLRRQPAPRPGPRQCRRRTWSPLGCCQKRMRPSLVPIERIWAFEPRGQNSNIRCLSPGRCWHVLFFGLRSVFPWRAAMTRAWKDQRGFPANSFSVLLRLQYCALRSVVIHSLCFWLSNYLSDGTFMSHVFNNQSWGLKSPRIFVTSVSATSFSNAFPLALVVSAMKAIAILPVSTVFDPERLRTSAPRNTSRRRNAKLTVKCGRCSARHKANTTSANPDFMALEPRKEKKNVNS